MRVSEIHPLQQYVVRRRVRRVPKASGLPHQNNGGYSPGFPAYTEHFKIKVISRTGRYVECVRVIMRARHRDVSTLKVTWIPARERLVVPSWMFCTKIEAEDTQEKENQ